MNLLTLDGPEGHVCCKCSSQKDLVPCIRCERLVCMRCRIGTGTISDGFECSMSCAIAHLAPSLQEPEKTGLWFVSWIKHPPLFLLGLAVGFLFWEILSRLLPK